MELALKLWSIWRNFFFKPVPAINLCLFRFFFGMVVLESALLNLSDVAIWYGDHGILSREVVADVLGSKCLDLILYLPNGNHAIWLFYWLHIISAICVSLGLLTRLSCIALYLTLSSLHFRDPVILNAGDDLMRVYAFFMMFAPAGAMLSLDQLIASRTKGDTTALRWCCALPASAGASEPDSRAIQAQNTNNAQNEQTPPKSAPETSLESCPTVTAWPQRLLQIELTLIYFQYFWTKMSGETWLDGTAVYYVLNTVNLEHFPWPFDRSNLLISKVLTLGTLVIEFALWNLIWWRPARYYILLAGLLLHFGLDYTLNIPVFQHVIFVSYILFVDPEHLMWFTSYLRRAVCRSKAA